MPSDSRLFFRLWGIALVVKIIIGMVFPFSPDEAYYWTWSHDLQWSYFDHPPFVAWLLWLGHPFEHIGQGVRIPGIILGHCSLLLWREILKPYLSSRQLIYFLIISLASPMIGAGSLLLTPDLPLLFFWALSLLLYLKCLDRFSAVRAFGLGLALGLGFCSKYHIVLFFALMLIHLTGARVWNRLRWFAIPLALLAFLIGATPVWIWNFENHFDSFLFQIHHGLGAPQISLRWPLGYVLDQVGVIFPVFAVLAFWASRKRLAPQWLSIWAWGPLLFFLFTAFKGRVEANWPIVAYPEIYALAAFGITPSSDATAILEPETKSERWALGSVLLWLFALMLMLTEVAFNWIPLEGARAKIAELHLYDPVKVVAESYSPFYASSYQMAAVLTYELRVPVARLRGLGRRSYYDYVADSMPKGEQFYIALRQWDQMPEWIKGWNATKLADINPEFRLIEFQKKSSTDTSLSPLIPIGGW